MKSIKLTLFLIALILISFSHSSGQIMETVRIGLVIDGSWEENSEMLQNIQREILALTTGEFDVQFPSDKTIQADWTIEKIRNAIDRLLSDHEVDLILTLGSISSQEVCTRKALQKPVIAPFIIDSDLQDCPIKDGNSGIKNLNYVSEPSPIKRDLAIFREIVPFKKCAILANGHYLESHPAFIEGTKKLFKELNLDLQLVGVRPSDQEPLASLEKDVDAVYILPLPFLSTDEYQAMATELIKRKCPSFSYTGAERVEQGILAGLNKDVLNRIARRVALNVQRILLGDEPESIPVMISLSKQLTINDATSRAIGVYLSWAVVTEAEVIGREQRRIDRELDMNGVVQEAVATNLELAAKGYYVAAGKQNVNEARSRLLPSIDLSSTYLVIDKDRAENSMGMQAERTLSGSVTATHVIFSEPAWANLSIQKSIQETREFEYQQLKLDITQDAVTGYLNVLRAKTFERIQQENLKMTRQNLELARLREVIGNAGPAEVYRWESEIALNRNAVIDANSQRNLAEIQVNRLLHRPAEESFNTLEADIHDPHLITYNKEIFQYIENRPAFRMFRQFMVEEGFQNSPELAALDAVIDAQERILRSATNRFWSPIIALQAGMDNSFSRKGAGTKGIDLPPEFSSLFQFPEPKDLSWNAALNISFPLFQGGAKFILRQKAIKELSQLQTKRSAVKELIEQRIRSALHIAGASYAAIAQVRLAAEAAHKSLKVVQDAYSKGLVSVVELLDAQNVVMLTDQLAANAVYDFLIDLMEVERAIGTSDFLATDEDREAFIQRAREYFEKAGFYLPR